MLSLGGWNEAKQKGIVKNVSKDYIVQDGEYIIILANKA
jgi:ribosome-binding ATPase YchF (GTP1/OBG family)